MEIEKGKYRHYKGGLYDVYDICTHSETLEKLVLYKAVNGKIWARPLSMFNETIVMEGKEVKRFEYVSDIE